MKKVKKVITEKVSKDVVYVNDVCALLRHVLHQRGMNPATTLIRVGLDGGGGNFKIMVSLCPGNGGEEEEEEESSEDDNVFVENLMTGTIALYSIVASVQL